MKGKKSGSQSKTGGHADHGELHSYSCSHVIERAQERYGLNLTPADYVTLNQLVRTSKPSPLSSDKDTEIYSVQYKDRQLLTVFHKVEQCVTTLLPPETVVKSRRDRCMKK